MPPLDLKQFEEIIGFLSPRRKIVIGESATRIIEGEPFLYKNILPLLQMIRNKFKKTPIQITTNGLLLNPEIIAQLLALGDIELNISVNCIHLGKRKKILGLKEEQDIRGTLQNLQGRIKFSGSCVMVPEIMEWADVEEIIAASEQYGAENVRIFLPGYTKLSLRQENFSELHDTAMGFVRSMRSKYTIPIVLEPAMMRDVDCFVEGIILDSPAAHSGLRAGDRIMEVNGVPVMTRVDGFDQAYRAIHPELLVERGGERLNIQLNKKRNTSPGFIVLYDTAPEAGEQIRQAVSRNQAEKTLVVTSALAFHVLEKLMGKIGIGIGYELLCVENAYFGGTIQCAGLLTVNDIVTGVREYLKDHAAPDLILVPPVMFDERKRDLLGKSLGDIENAVKIKTEIP